MRGFRVTGQQGVNGRFNRTEARIKEGLKAEAERAGRLTEADAKTAARVDMGKLRQSIAFEMTTPFVAKVSANAPYAPFIEFGTGGLVEIPEGWADEAALFKGSGKRVINLAPHPFLIPAWTKAKTEYLARVQKLLSTASNG